MQNVSSRELCAFCAFCIFYLVTFVGLFYPDDAVRHTAGGNLLNDIEIKRYLLPSLMGSPDLGATHCVKCVQIHSYFWSLFSHIWTEYGEIRSISPYSVRMRENTDQKELRIWTLFTQ